MQVVKSYFLAGEEGVRNRTEAVVHIYTVTYPTDGSEEEVR
jgi:hypothetical protein